MLTYEVKRDEDMALLASTLENKKSASIVERVSDL
jgi:hypothetical protein